MKVEFNPDGRTVLNTYGDESMVGVFYPHDTAIRAETETGRPRPHGPLVISRTQPDGWPDRAGRVWDERQRQWVLSGVPPVTPEDEQALDRLKQVVIPDAPTPEQTAQILRDLQVLIQHDRRDRTATTTTRVR